MKKKDENRTRPCPKHGERGAALVTALLLSTLLLAAGGALIATSTMGSTTAIDSTAEMQAYYAAESGLQSALAVLRGNVAARTDIIFNPPPGTKMKNNLRAANLLSTSNVPGDASTEARLSGWLRYNGTGVNARVQIDNNLAYQLRISDPDDPTRASLNNAALNYSPTRLVIEATGFGPKGSRKQMRMIIRRGAFDFEPPSTLTMTGNVNFQLGNSNAKGYSGEDASGAQPPVPMFGFTDAASHGGVYGSTFDPACTSSYCDKAREGTTDPESAVISGTSNPPVPAWLRTPADARQFLNDLQAQAQSEGRYFATKDGVGAPSIGTAANPQFTFVDGNLSAGGSGAGLLVVTGNLTFSGNFDFDGVILVLGSYRDAGNNLVGGSLQRNGGGNGTIAGAVVVSAFDRTDPAGGFLPTTFNTNGGGNSDIMFDSVKVDNALNSLGSRILGVSEF